MARSTGYTRRVPSPIPSGAPVHARAAYLLARVGRSQQVRFAERMRMLGLRPKHFAVLNAVALSDGASQQELGGRMGLDPSGLVGAIDQLEDMGLVARRRDPADPPRYAGGLTAGGAPTPRRARPPAPHQPPAPPRPPGAAGGATPV